MDITRPLVFLAVFFALFAPKLGPLDTSPLAAAISVLLLAHQRKVRVPREYLVVVLLMFALLAWSIVATLANASTDMYATLRMSRCLLTTSALALAVYNLDIEPGELLDIILAVLALNAVAVLVEIAFPSTQAILSSLYGFNKVAIRTLRAFGLTAGYDTAGYLCVIGALISALKSLAGRRTFAYLLAMTLFTASACFTSRSSMTLNLLVMASVCVVFMFRGGTGLKLVGVLFLGAGFALVTRYMIPLIMATFIMDDLQFEASDAGGAEYTENFSRTDLSVWRSTMWILPDGFWLTLFGTGANVPESDMGYVKIIFMSGLVGLVIAVWFYGYLLVKAVAMRKQISEAVTPGADPDMRSLTLMLVVFLFAIYIVNVKNLYFFTRAYHELAIILFFTALSRSSRMEQAA